MTTLLSVPAGTAVDNTAHVPGTPSDTAGRIRLVPVERRGRPVGAYVVGPDAVTFRPVVDVTRLATTGVAAVVLAAAITAVATTVRRPPAIGTVTMGPGGWISLKRTAAPPLRAGGHRPWWAHVLRAHRLVVEQKGYGAGLIQRRPPVPQPPPSR